MVIHGKAPPVSLAMPAYNCERYIAQAIESLLSQSYGDFEFVISDNASTDGTESICRHYAALDRRVRYVRRSENVGGPGNFRYVFSLCTGGYHKWSTADDHWHPEFLKEAVAVLQARPDVVLCYPRTRLIDAAGEKIEDYADDLALEQESARERWRALYRLIGLCNAHLGLLRREAMLKTRLIAGHPASDVDFLGEMALQGKFCVLPEIRFYRRYHPASSSWSRHDSSHQQAYYAPQASKRIGLDRWRRLSFRFGMLARGPLGVADRLVLAGDLLHQMRWDRAELVQELKGRFLPR
ncbi:MAG: glycosyltransferase family 2 protein [Burkholderiaceae bacterium]|nr:glycosyltransferase family 2 protein [Burkholderiaceae bacterium]